MTQRDVTRPTTVGAGVAGSWSPLADQQVVLEHVTPARAAFRRFLRHRLAIIGVVIVTTIILLAILAPLLTPWPPNKIDFTTGSRHAPNAAHILGTDVSARDIWSRVLYGGRTSTVVGFGAVALYLVIGTLLGLAAGFYGGVAAARVIGVPDRVILFRHTLPNIFGPLTVVATFGVATAVLLESSLSFLGLGVRPPEASWGNLITEATSPVVLNHLPWQWMPAAAAITLMVLGVNFIGDGLRDALDPRTIRRG